MNQGEAKIGNNEDTVPGPVLQPVILGELEWHQPYNTCAFSLSADGRYIFTAGLSNRIGQRNRKTGQLVRFFQHEAGAVYTLAGSPEGRYLCAGRDDGRIDQWDLARGERIRSLEGHAREINTLVFAPNGRYLYSGGSDGAIFEWDTVTGERIRGFAAHSDFVMAVIITPDGKRLYSGGMDDKIIRWNLETGISTVFEEGQPDGVRCLCLSPDGCSLYCGGYAHYLSEWDPAQERLERTIEGSSSLAALCFSPDGRTLYGSDDDGTYKLDLNNDNEMETLCYSGGRSLFCAPDGKTLYSGILEIDLETGSDQEWVGQQTCDARVFFPNHTERNLFISHNQASGQLSIHQWDLAGGKRTRFWSVEEGLRTIETMTLSDDGCSLFACSEIGNQLVWWDLQVPGLSLSRLPAGKVGAFCLVPDGRIYTGECHYDQHEGRAVKEWHMNIGGALRQFDGHTGNIMALAFSPDGQYLYSGGEDHSIIQWDLRTGEKVRTMKVQGLVIEQLAVSPDGQYLYSRTMDGIREWHQGEGTLIANCFGTFALSPDGRFIYYQIKGSMMRWDCRERREIRLWDEPPGFSHLIAGDKLLYCGRENGSVTIYNLENGGANFTLYNLDQGFLFIAPDETGQVEYFWTDRSDLIGITEVDPEGNLRRFLMSDEVEARDYFAAHNRQDLIMQGIKRVMDLQKHEE
jgi:WD40 repeat protein